MKTLTVRCSIEIFGQNRIKKNSPRKFGHEYNLRVKNQNFGKNYKYFLSKNKFLKHCFKKKINIAFELIFVCEFFVTYIFYKITYCYIFVMSETLFWKTMVLLTGIFNKCRQMWT